MVELDVEDERFTNGTGGYTMPLKTEEVTSDAEESTTSAHDSEYEGMSGSEAGFKVGSSVVSDDEGGRMVRTNLGGRYKLCAMPEVPRRCLSRTHLIRCL